MAGAIKAVHGVAYVPEQSSQLYRTAGDTTDWTYGTYAIPSFIIELRPSSAEEGGFVVRASQIEPTYQENRAAAFLLIDRLLGSGAATPAGLTPSASKRPRGAAEGGAAQPRESSSSLESGVVRVDSTRSHSRSSSRTAFRRATPAFGNIGGMPPSGGGASRTGLGAAAFVPCLVGAGTAAVPSSPTGSSGAAPAGGASTLCSPRPIACTKRMPSSLRIRCTPLIV